MKYLICDLDNTLLDTLGRLEEIVDSYSIENQNKYNLVGEQLKPFIDGRVYEGVAFNREVVMTISAHITLGYTPIFISQTLSETAKEHKRKLVKHLAPYLGHTNFPLVMGSQEIFHFIEGLEGKIVFIDDAPQRLRWFSMNFPESKVYKVEYPYNQFKINNYTISLQRGE